MTFKKTPPIEVFSAEEARMASGRDYLYHKLMNSVYAKIRKAANEGQNATIIDTNNWSKRFRQRAKLDLYRQGYSITNAMDLTWVWRVEW